MTVPLITRKAWGAQYQDGFGLRPMPFSEFWLHHSVTIAPDLVPPFDDDDAAIRTLERIGEQRFSGGISYNQPVTPVGRCYVGVSENRIGAHTYMSNTVGFAFVLVGDYSKKPPTAIQEEIIARRMVELHRAGKSTRHTLNGGHRDSPGAKTYPSACPGDAAHARIPAINARANELWKLNYPAVDQPYPGTEEDPLMGMSNADIARAVWRTDGVVTAPDGNPDNPEWWAERYLVEGWLDNQQIKASLKAIAEGQGGAPVTQERAEQILREEIQAALKERDFVAPKPVQQ